VVIRRSARHVDQAEAADCIAGYTIANDLTTRDRLRQAGPGRMDYLAAKNPPTFLPTDHSWCQATRWTRRGCR